MSKADSLRLQDVHDAYRLIGDCRDLGQQPARWYQHMLDGLSRLFGVLQAAGGEARRHHDRPVEIISAYSVSREPEVEQAFRAYHDAKAQARDPLDLAMQRLSVCGVVARTREQLVADRDWYASDVYPYYRMARVGPILRSEFRAASDGVVSGISLNRAMGERNFSARERRLLEFFHGEIGRLIGGPLASATEPGVEHLSPRLRQTLARLLQGDSEKEIAARLGLSQATIHQYVGELYRRFGVDSRPRLLARVFQRFPRLQADLDECLDVNNGAPEKAVPRGCAARPTRPSGPGVSTPPQGGLGVRRLLLLIALLASVGSAHARAVIEGTGTHRRASPRPPASRTGSSHAGRSKRDQDGLDHGEDDSGFRRPPLSTDRVVRGNRSDRDELNPLRRVHDLQPGRRTRPRVCRLLAKPPVPKWFDASALTRPAASSRGTAT